jgi:sulfopyruvate decarboxylase subunit beta
MAIAIEETLIQILKDFDINIVAALPCEKIRYLYSLTAKHFRQVSLSREEEGIAVCAGAYLAGARAILLIQSSGIGNSINAICSLAKVYRFPLPILVSWRGVYQENIPAQIPMGQCLLRIFQALDIKVTIIEKEANISLVKDVLESVYRDSIVEVVLFAPSIWTNTDSNISNRSCPQPRTQLVQGSRLQLVQPTLTRYEVIETVSPFLEDKIIVSNLGVPSKELYQIKDQVSNFYMLGSMGMATPFGLGIAMNTPKSVVVIDGDGSILMNPGSLATVAQVKPKNLSIIAIDNGCHGSTGGQSTATAYGVNLELVARGFGFRSTYQIATREEITQTFITLTTAQGPHFIHILAKPGNAKVTDIPFSPETIRQRTMRFLRDEN